MQDKQFELIGEFFELFDDESKEFQIETADLSSPDLINLAEEKNVELFCELKAYQIKTADLVTPDLANLVQTSKHHFNLFKPLLDIRQLLQYIVLREQDHVQKMLQTDIHLLYKRDNITDVSGRTFYNITGFEYALWALDADLWKAMIECIPRGEKGRMIFNELLIQYNNINKNGVTYRLEGKMTRDPHFDFENTIIKELQTQLEWLSEPEPKDWNAIDNQWREGVGCAQKIVPMHVIDSYCSEQPFDRVYEINSEDPFDRIPTFTSQPESSRHFENLTTDRMEKWFSMDSKLGEDFAIAKGPQMACGWPRVGPLRSEYISADLYALKALFAERMEDFKKLKFQLEEETLDNRHQFFLE